MTCLAVTDWQLYLSLFMYWGIVCPLCKSYSHLGSSSPIRVDPIENNVPVAPSTGSVFRAQPDSRVPPFTSSPHLTLYWTFHSKL